LRITEPPIESVWRIAIKIASA